jgi:hypothetical protein
MTFHSEDGQDKRTQQPEESIRRHIKDSEATDSQVSPISLNTSTETGRKRRRYY